MLFMGLRRRASREDEGSVVEKSVSELLTIKECSERAKVSPRTIWREIGDGKLVAIRVRGSLRILLGDWERYLQQCRSPALGLDLKSRLTAPGGGLAVLLGVPRRTAGRKGGSRSRRRAR
jgi:hypothetical protein